jgi:hypothetical protein
VNTECIFLYPFEYKEHFFPWKKKRNQVVGGFCLDPAKGAYCEAGAKVMV